MSRVRWPSTHAELLEQLRCESQAVAGWRQLAERYERPARRYLSGILARYGLAADADAVFNTCLLGLAPQPATEAEGNTPWHEKYDCAQGSFRDYYRGILYNYAMRHVTRTFKNRKTLGLEQTPPPTDDGPDPGEAYDRDCAKFVIREALTRTQAVLDERGKGLAYQVLAAYYLGEGTTSDREVAQRLGVPGPTAEARRQKTRRLRTEAEEEFRAEFLRGLESEVPPSRVSDEVRRLRKASEKGLSNPSAEGEDPRGGPKS